MYLEQPNKRPIKTYYENVYKKRVAIPKYFKAKYPHMTIGASWDDFHREIFLYLVQNNKKGIKPGIVKIIYEENIKNVPEGISLNKKAQERLVNSKFLESIL